MTRTGDPMVGRMLSDRYEIVSKIARGGMATVYVAHDHRLGRDCAVKILHEGLSGDADFTRKFRREARAAARLTHNNVVAVFDQGVDGDRPYIVMEYVPGSTLRRVISNEGALPPLRALELLEPVLAALAAAHQAGLVHRDVKPENVLISERGHVKVADFGLARAVSGDTATATAGVVMGTVSYIPPELVMHGKGDERSDVYSAGVVLFEMLTGRKPHQGDSPIQVAYAHCNHDIVAPSSLRDTSWRDSRQAIPPYVDALVLAATSRDPEKRPADAGVMLSHLRVATRALRRNIMNDARIDAEMRRTGLESTDPLPAPARTPRSPRSVSTATSAASASSLIPPTPARPPHPGPTRWVARTPVGTPLTPISPVDLASAPSAVPVPFYDDEVRAEVEPPTPLPESMLRGRRHRRTQTRRRTGSTRREREAERLQRRRWAPLVALLSVLLIAGSAAYTSWYLLAGQFTSVPAVAGLPLSQAQAKAEQAHTHLTVTEQFSESAPAGTVIKTDPGVGTRVQQNAEVSVVVSRGPERFAVPTLVGLTTEQARSRLSDAHLTVSQVVEQFDEKAPAGQVLAASLSSGTKVKRGTGVELTVSKGPKPIVIANYTGRDGAAAQAALKAKGFKVTTTQQHHKTVPAGMVISQTPSSGTGKRGDKVELIISQGPVMVAVPATRQMKTADAKAALEKAGFKVTASPLPNPAPMGVVSYSTPAAGTKVAEGSTITLYTV